MIKALIKISVAKLTKITNSGGVEIWIPFDSNYLYNNILIQFGPRNDNLY